MALIGFRTRMFRPNHAAMVCGFGHLENVIIIESLEDGTEIIELQPSLGMHRFTESRTEDYPVAHES